MKHIDEAFAIKFIKLLYKSHTGKQGGGYGCLKEAAILAVDELGDEWILPKHGCRLNKTAHDWMVSNVRATCPPNSNIDRVKQKFFEYANKHATDLKVNPSILLHKKLITNDLLKSLE